MEVQTQNTLGSSRSNSHTSSNSEIEKELQDLEITNNSSTNIITKNGTLQITSSLSPQTSKTILTSSSVISVSATTSTKSSATSTSTSTTSSSSSITTTPTATTATTTVAVNNLINKKRISNSNSINTTRTPARKAKRIKFYRNGDRFYSGITIPVSNERYRSFESLAEDLTRLLEENVKIPGAVRNIYTLSGKKVSNLDDLEDGQSYVCSCNNEGFKKIDYNLIQQQQQSQQQQQQQNQNNLTTKLNNRNRLSKLSYRPSSPLKNGTNGSPILKLSERDSVVHPRIVTLIRNGTKPRKIMRLLLNKRNSPSFDHVLTAITQVVKLDTGCVRKVFTLSGQPVLQLADFFGQDDIFFAYGTERVNPDDFKLEPDELKIIQQTRKPLKSNVICNGPKPKMPIKSSAAQHNVTYDYIEASLNERGINSKELPQIIRDRYILGYAIGDGNFAVVLQCKDKQTNQINALKIIDKSKCRGKEHYIDAEVRVMKKLNHPHIISLILDVDQPNNMYLVLEYVGGGDLFDAITRVTRFSEDQSRIMIKHLASAMAYLHSMSIVHRDIKPENLLVELDDKGNVLQLKLADFGLACEVTEPLTAVCGTPTYVAPEILMETGYGLKIDVWAAGIILYILLCGFPPFVAPDNQQEPLFDAILSGIYEFPEPYWTDIGEGVRDLISNMLQSDPNVRFSSEDILDHYWTLGETYEYS